MRLRLYQPDDFAKISSWADNEKTHAFWLADKIAYPPLFDDFYALLDTQKHDYGALPYCMEDDNGVPKAFCLYLENEENEGFIKFVIVDPECRGCGYGTEFIRMMLKHAFGHPNILDVRLNVYDVNEAARRCYEKAGFQEQNYYPDKVKRNDEHWGVYSMIVFRENWNNLNQK